RPRRARRSTEDRGLELNPPPGRRSQQPWPTARRVKGTECGGDYGAARARVTLFGGTKRPSLAETRRGVRSMRLIGLPALGKERNLGDFDATTGRSDRFGRLLHSEGVRARARARTRVGEE